MTSAGGWTPLTGAKVPAEATHPSQMSFPTPKAPKVTIPSTTDDGFMDPFNCGGHCGCEGNCSSSGSRPAAVNIASGSLLYHYKIPENTIPVEIYYESDQAGILALGTADGWTTNLHRRIEKSGTTVTVKTSDGGSVDYEKGTSVVYYPTAGYDNIVVESPVIADLFTEILPNGVKFVYDLSESGRLTNIEDPDGRKWTFTYSTGTQLSSVENHRSRLVTLHYDGSRIEAIEDTAGRLTSFSYTSGKLSQIEDAVGCLTTFEYTTGTVEMDLIEDPDHRTEVVYSSSKVQTVKGVDANDTTNKDFTTFTYASSTETAVKNPLGQVTSYLYDSSEKYLDALENAEEEVTTFNWSSTARRVTSVVNPRSVTTRYTWELVSSETGETRRRLKAIEPGDQGDFVTYTYEAAGSYRVKSEKDQLGNVTTYTYDEGHLRSLQNAKRELTTWVYANDVLTSIEDARGNPTTLTFGSQGLVQTVEDAEGNVTTFGYDAAANPAYAIDALNHRTTFAYDASNRRTVTHDAQGGITTITYEVCGLVQSETDARGYTTTYTYDHNGQRTETIDALENIWTFTYDKARNRISQQDALARVATWTYDKVGRAVARVDALDQTSTTSYDANGNVISQEDPSGAIVTTQYDDLDRVQVSIDALKYRTTYAYDAAGNQTSITDARGNVTTKSYDELNRLESEHRADGGISTTVYDEVGNVRATIDTRNYRTTNTYNKVNRLIAVENATNYVTTTSYDATGRRRSEENARGAVTTWSYDKIGRVIDESDPLECHTTYAYDASGNRTSRTDARGNRSDLVYDELGRRTVEVSPLSERTTTSYDAVGNATEIQYPNGDLLTRTFDSLNRRVTETNPAGYVQTIIYDDVQRAHGAIDFDGNRTTRMFDARGDLSTEISSEEILVTYTYDEARNRRSREDGAGKLTTFSYDGLNRLEAIEDPLKYLTTFSYDTEGNLSLRMNAGGIVTTYSYDEINRRSRIDYASSFVTYEYDEVGNLKRWSDLRGFHSLSYDLRNSVTSMKRGDGLILTYTYDNVRNRKTLTDEIGGLQTYSYDALNRVEVLVNPANEKTTFSYDSLSRVRLIECANNTDTTYGYDATGGVNEIRTYKRSDPGVILSTQTYTLDRSGRPKEMFRVGHGAVPVTAITTFIFDKDHRIVREKRTSSNSTNEFDITYTYDKANNVKTKERDAVVTTFFYDARGSLTDVEAAASSESRTLEYDPRANLVLVDQDAGLTTYVYDEESRLTKVEDSTSGAVLSQVYRYDAFSDRSSWTDEDGAFVTEVRDQEGLLSQDRGVGRNRFTDVSLPSGRQVVSQSSGSRFYTFNSLGSLDTLAGSSASFQGEFISTWFCDVVSDVSGDSGQIIVPKCRAREGWLTDSSGGIPEAFNNLARWEQGSDFHYWPFAYGILWITEVYKWIDEFIHRRCGPDVTDWLKREMAINSSTKHLQPPPRWLLALPVIGAVYLADHLLAFANCVKPRAVWDFKSQHRWVVDGCPSQDCRNTVSICGICFHQDVPGNIHYGYLCRAFGFRDSVCLAAPAVPALGNEPAHDVWAVLIGMTVYDKNADLCKLVTLLNGFMNRGAPGERGYAVPCRPCSIRYDAPNRPCNPKPLPPYVADPMYGY